MPTTVNVSNFQPAFDLMIELGGDVIPMYRRLVRAICTGNVSLLEATQQQMRWVHWEEEEFLSMIHIEALVTRRTLVVAEEQMREKLIKTALMIKQVILTLNTISGSFEPNSGSLYILRLPGLLKPKLSIYLPNRLTSFSINWVGVSGSFGAYY